MIYLIDLCGFPWCILPWLLSGLLGFLMGYFWMKKWQSKFEEMEGKYNSLRKTNDKLQADLDECRHKRATLEGDLSTAHGMVKEMKVKVDNANASLADAEAKAEAAIKSAASNSGGKGSTAADVGSLASGFAAGAVTSNLGGDNKPKEEAASTTTGGGAGKGTGAYGKLKSSNLQIIEGIGPKMESVLHDAGIKNWAELGAKSPEELRAVLDGHGDKYKIINPSTWAQQSQLAADGKWDDLILLQKQLDGGNATNINMTDSKLEKMIGKTKKAGFSKYKENDLKIVEGVGPKIAELMNNAGINTWAELSNTSVGKLQEILDAAGARYKLARPGSWPKQAGLAASGQWDALKKLQDELDGGK